MIRYFCKGCSQSFSSKKQNNEKNLWRDYAIGKQTQKEIGQKLKKSREWVNLSLKKASSNRGKNHILQPQKIILIVDTTYFNQFGLMVFRSSNLRKNLLWKITDQETNEQYASGIQELFDDGWEILGIIADGKPGLGNLFPGIPFQKCHFHQFQTVTQCISKNPKL